MSAETYVHATRDDLDDLAARFRSHPSLRMELPAGAQLAHGFYDGLQEAMVISFPATEDAPHGIGVLIKMNGDPMDLWPEDEAEA